MNNITKSRLLSIVVIVLLIANIAALTIFWLKRVEKKMPPQSKHQAGGPFAFLVKELDFDSVQTMAYKNIRDEHQKDVEGYRSAIRKAKDDLFALLKEPNTNENSLQNALNNVGEKEKIFDKVVFLHFQKVRALCTETQKKKFDEIIQEALRMVPASPQRQDPPPPRGDGNRDEGSPKDGENRRRPPPGAEDGNHMPPPPENGNHPSQ